MIWMICDWKSILLHLQIEWTCLKNISYSFAVVRIFRKVGVIDSNAADTIRNARTAGISNVDGYIFPCFNCGNPRAQVQTAVQNLHENKAEIDGIWIDIESPEYWSLSAIDNLNFIRELVDEVKNQNYSVGIYASASQWDPITNGSIDFRDVRLWHARWDKNESFDNFKSFGGWTKPVMKQYVGDVAQCDVNVDKDWRN